MKEKTIEAAVIAWVKMQGGIAMKVEAKGVRGWPDLDITLPGGRVALVEMKRPGGTVSPHQAGWCYLLMQLGRLAFVAESLEEVQRRIHEHYD